MTGFIEQTPVLSLILENPLVGARYPEDGEALAVLDTGYEGFLSIPREIFHTLRLESQEVDRRNLSLADGRLTTSEGTYARLLLPELELAFDGFCETYSGLEEIILGTDAIRRMRVLLDYCAGSLKLEVCP